MAKPKTRLPSKIPVNPEPEQDSVSDEIPDGHARVEGEESIVDKLLNDLLSVEDLKKSKNVLTKTAEGLKKIVEEQNVTIKQQAEEIKRLRQSKAFTAQDEHKLFSMFAEILFDAKSSGDKVVKIAGRRSHKFRTSSPSLLEALEALRNA